MRGSRGGEGYSLNESQRAMIAARIANMPAHRPSNKSANLPTSIDQGRASELLNVGERSLRYAKEVQETGSSEWKISMKLILARAATA